MDKPQDGFYPKNYMMKIEAASHLHFTWEMRK